MSLETEKSMSTFAARPAIASRRQQRKNHRRGRVSRPPQEELGPVLSSYYDAMSSSLGPMHWWPAKTPFEVIVGAILTQNTAWTNVEKAIDNLRQAKLLTPAALARVSLPRLAKLIRSSGYFRQKAKKLKAFVGFLRRGYGGSLAKMFRRPTAELREELLGVHGIGPETADSILLYAGNHPVFVVDAYTRRILTRHDLASEKTGYEEVRELFETNLPRDPRLWNEYHALIVNVGKNWCRNRNPRCEECPLRPFLPTQHLATSQIESSIVAEHRA
jgi:endonuclease III related protein